MTTDGSRADVTIIGGGLAGCEAAWQAANRGCAVSLYEMKPQKFSAAHQSQNLGELVCSNSLRSNDPHSAVGLLKDEMRALDSLIMEVADTTAVPAGKALAVDRERFAATISQKISDHPLIDIVRHELTVLPDRSSQIKVLASGPLTAEPLAQDLARFTGKERLYFYDAIAPIVSAESLDMQVIYRKSRYDDGAGDYLNCPLSRADYLRFIRELSTGKCTSLHDFEEPKYFEGCLPIEVMRSRGDDTLRFGPMKPVGLENPQTGEVPYAVVQLRMEDRAGTHYNMVGFQTKLIYPEQKRIFQMIPGLQRAEFLRYGSIHRNTFICAPEILRPTLQTRSRPDLLIAGQLSGVEGYVESAAMGLLAGLNSARLCHGLEGAAPPAETALGSLVKHLTESDPRHFQPSNINFGLFPPWEKKIPKRLRGEIRAQRSRAALQNWREIFQI